MKSKNKLGKKAQFFFFFMAILTIVAMITIFFMIGLKKEAFKEPIGTKAFEIIKMSQETEKMLVYIDYSAKNSAWLSAWNLADNGGILNPIELYNGYALWKRTSINTLTSSDYRIAFINGAKENLYKFINNYAKGKTITTSKLSEVTLEVYDEKQRPIEYDLITIDNSLIGSANHPLFALGKRGPEIKGEITKGTVRTYAVSPSFNVNINYDLEEYQTMITQASDLMNDCAGKGNQTFACINSNKPTNWDIGDCDGNIADKTGITFRFCVDSEYTIPHFTANKLKNQKLKYKFALDFTQKIVSIT